MKRPCGEASGEERQPNKIHRGCLQPGGAGGVRGEGHKEREVAAELCRALDGVLGDKGRVGKASAPDLDHDPVRREE